MDFGMLFQLLLMISSAGARMVSLAVGDVIHTTDVGVPPVFVNWRDGRQFTVSLHITRTK